MRPYQAPPLAVDLDQMVLREGDELHLHLVFLQTSATFVLYRESMSNRRLR